MTVQRIPVSFYQPRAGRPTTKFGQPASVALRQNVSEVFAAFTFDKIPNDAVISSAILRVFTIGGLSASPVLRAYDITGTLKSSITWGTRPSVGSQRATVTPVNPAASEAIDFDITAWAVNRPRKGVRLDTTYSTAPLWLRGSTATTDKPVLIVTYSVAPEMPSNLTPQGGAVSVPKPVLSYIADDAMTEQKIQYSTDGGSTVAYDTGWIAATDGRYSPAAGAPSLASGATMHWRVQTRGPNGTSQVTPWVSYSYVPLPAVTITTPAATSIDGSPALTWTVSGQVSYKADFYRGSRLIDTSGWANAPSTRTWTPGEAIPVPGATGRFELAIRDSVVRARAESAPTHTSDTKIFTTTSSGASTAITNTTATFNDPVVTVTGTLGAGLTPAEVALFRDGKIVNIWGTDDEVYRWAPIAQFKSGQTITIKDFTAGLRTDHTWQIYVRGGGLADPATGPAASANFMTKGAWLVNPRTGVKVEIIGFNEVPVVDMATTEQSIVHTPLNGDVKVEPKRRRLMRLTKAGTVTGAVTGANEAVLTDWAEDDSALKYRLVFGRVNWPVILGDFNPVEWTGYGDTRSPERVRVSFNWWQRLTDS